MSAPTLLLVGHDPCFARMLSYELEHVGYCVVSDGELPRFIDCAVVDVDTATPPEGIPYVGCTRMPERAEGDSRILLRPFLVSALISALELARQTSPTDSTPLTLSSTDSDRCARFGHARLTLMPAEYALFKTLLDANGRPVTRDELTAALPSGRQPASNLLEVTVCSLRKKLENTFGIRPIRTVRGVGWRLETEQ